MRAGLDNGRGGFLTHRVQDLGFGAFHEVEYSNQVVQLLGVEPDYGPLAFTLHDADFSRAEELLKGHTGKPRIAVHPWQRQLQSGPAMAHRAVRSAGEGPSRAAGRDGNRRGRQR